MGNVVELKTGEQREDEYEPVVEQLKRRIDELPEWCREGVEWVIEMGEFGAHISRERGRLLREVKDMVAVEEAEANPMACLNALLAVRRLIDESPLAEGYDGDGAEPGDDEPIVVVT